jgi:hypothetical protein
MALTTAKSIAGSSTEIPPVMFRKTSLAPSLKPALFSNANHIEPFGIVASRTALWCSVTAVLTSAEFRSLMGACLQV